MRQVSPKLRVENTSIPVSIMQQYKNITLSVNSMTVADIPFLVTRSRHIKFGSAGKLDNMKNGHILKHCKVLISTYVDRDFKVTVMLTDNQFEPMRGDLANLHTQLRITSRDKHLPEIERCNHTMND